MASKDSAEDAGLRHRSREANVKSNREAEADEGGKADSKHVPGDYGSIFLLLVLYTLQGLPMGLSAYVKMRLKETFKGEFSQIGTFALTTWPFSLKLFWAPIVDAFYVERFGRRKTWLVPSQLLIAGGLLYLSVALEDLFGQGDYATLTVLFFSLYLLCATQDIAVDGWSVTMLHPANAGYSSTCNAAGQGLGFFLGMVGPTMGLVSVQSFFIGIAAVFLLTTLGVCFLKTEAPTPAEEQVDGILDAYSSALQIARLEPVQMLCFILLTRSIAFVPVDEMMLGKFQDAGLQTSYVAWLRSCATPLEFIMPWVLTRLPWWRKPLAIVHGSYLPRVFLTLVAGIFVHFIGKIPDPAPASLLASIATLMLLQGIFTEVMFGAHFAFFATVSDPKVAGTYMTLLSAIHNMGNAFAVFGCLKTVDSLESWTGHDGFYLLSCVCGVFGMVWFILASPVFTDLQSRPKADWCLKHGAGK